MLAPLKGAEHREIGGVQLDVVRIGAARVKRMIYLYLAGDARTVAASSVG